MSKIRQPGTQGKGTWDEARKRDLLRYNPKRISLIPLHKPKAKMTLPNGTVREIGKAPLHAQWTTKAYDSKAVRDAAMVEGRNVGVRLTDSQLVIDVDPRNGGEAGFAALCHDIGFDGDAFPRVITGSGGWHCYMAKPADVLVRDTLESDEYDGVEFKSKGRQVVAAGSIHPNGNPYKWSPDHPDIEDGLPKIPGALLNVIKRPPRGDATGGGQYTPEKIADVLSKLDVTEFDSNDKWLNLMMACHHASAGDARQEFVDWSTTDPNYAKDAFMIGKRWDSLHADRDDGVTYRTLNKILRDNGAASAQVAKVAEDEFPDDDGEGGGSMPWDDEPDDDDDDAMPWDDDADDDVTNPVAVMSRGLKVNKQSVAADTFKNAMGAIITTGLQPAFNEMAKHVEFIGDVPWDESKFGRVLDDAVLSAVRLCLVGKFQGNDYDPSLKHLNEALDAAAYGRRFNPVRDYLDSLEWDGTSRVAKLFGQYFNCGIDAYTRGVSIAFMVGAVARIRKPGCKFDTAPVLKGPQGWNKSTAFRVLFGDAYFSDTNLGPLTNKDASMKLRGKWCHEFAEIESLRKHEINHLKAFISSQVDRQRDPYERRVADVPRCTVFAGTVNEGGYLGDATGGRRFWPLELRERIDVAALAADRDQLWAEAAKMESDGVSRVLPAKLWPVAAERQEAETIDDPWEDVLRDFLARRAAPRDLDGTGDDDDSFGADPLPPDRVHTSELFDALNIPAKDQTNRTTGRLRTIMEARLGWHHKKAVRIGDAVRAGYDVVNTIPRRAQVRKLLGAQQP